ncbi:hypothetical protein CVT26_009198 [Gymnopilus dilepis]|uniref:DUF6534 domain-containing protein n=1 Tax=Gymnopilus dilepis TaxID=231916 RepID=A0A409Y9Q4_9AGAR|nr:hypothetical protein CVT26_009198 [Gymnopilus dilepis]
MASQVVSTSFIDLRFRYGTYTRFSEEVKWVFTCVLALSTAVDMLSTGSLFALLHTSRTGAPRRFHPRSVNALIDTLIMFAFETASLTSAGTVVTMICWLAMPNNIVFLGVHFVIGKLYALSLLVTLNMREDIRRGRSAGVKKDAKRGSSDLTQNGAVLEVKVERTVHYDV